MTDVEITLNAWEINYATVLAVQGESNGRTIKTTLIDRAGQTDGSFNAASVNRPIDLTGVTARLYCIKPDGTKTFSDGIVTDAANGKISFVLPYQATACAGNVACQMLLTKSDNSTVKAIGLNLNVQESDLDGAAESTNEYSALVAALNKADAAVASVAACNAATSAANTATSNANSAATAANSAASSANSAATAANSGAQSANSAASAANTAKSGADTAAQSASSAATAANTARQACDTSTAAASTAAENAKAKADAADTAANAANTAASSANAAASTASQAAGNAQSLYQMIDPTTGKMDYITNILKNLEAYIFDGAITAQAFDNLNLTAQALDSKNISARDFDAQAKVILGVS